METKVFTLRQDILWLNTLYLKQVLIRTNNLIRTSWQSSYWLAGGTLLCMLTGMWCQKGWGVSKGFCLKTATDLYHHDLKLGLVRKLRERMNTFPSTPNEWERKRRNQSPPFGHNFPAQFYLPILDFRIDRRLNPC